MPPERFISKYIPSIYMIKSSYNSTLDREQIIREVTLIGNGAHIFAPKEWAGEKVFVIRAIKPSLKEKILKILEPHLESILGVYIYGSYARGEQREDSDIDLLVVSNKQIKMQEKGFEVIAIEEDKLRDAIKIAPILIYSALKEAKTVINPKLLSDLREKHKPKKEDFKDYTEETKNIIKINEELPDSYSIILRLRGIYLIECLFSEEEYSYWEFKKWAIKDTDKKIDFDGVYNSYLKAKNNLKAEANEDDMKMLLSVLKDKVKKLEKRIYG